MARVLIADDDPHLREVLRYALTRDGHEVREATNGAEALRAVLAQSPDLVVLDIVMPTMDGLQACREIRQKSAVPIVFLSSRDEELDRVLGLEMGGDDYLTKPFSTRELCARVKAVLRRARPAEPSDDPAELLKHGALRMDTGSHKLFVATEAGDREVVLTVTEFSLLRVLLSRPGRAFSREELTNRAYGDGYHLAERTLDSHIRRIRAKLREHGLDPIETVQGLGYRLGG
jgi:two-component system OmpR family response regulator